ncbi:MAG: hypothetical protein K6T85_06575 [Gorillibacterium sp.]|nr:hypothetical protein [Gorillibacterium sp.]
MAKKKRDYKFRPFEGVGINGKHLRITDSMMDSTAWQELSPHAIVLYVYFKKKFNYSNEDNISFTYKEGTQLMKGDTFTKSLDQLIDLGFIKILQSGWSNRTASIYGFNDQWKYYGTKDFHVISRVKRTKNKDN